MAEKKQPAKRTISLTPENIQVSPVYADALRYLLFAQELDPTGRYARFVQNLSIRGIPYEYTDPRFLAALVDFANDFKAYLRDSKISESKIESSVPRIMVESLSRELTAMPATIRGVKRERIEHITNTYVKQLRRVVGRFDGEEAFKKNLTEEVTRLAQESNTTSEFEDKLEDAFTNKAAAASTDPAKIAEVARPVARNVLARATSFFPALLASAEEEPVVTKALVESPVKRKDLWMKTYTQRAGREANPNIEDVNRLAATAEAFLSIATGPDLTKPTLFFRTGAKGLQKPLAILTDAVLEVFPKETRDAVIESVLRRGWEVATQTDKLNKKFGEFVVDSGVLQAAIEKGNLAFGTKEPRSFKGLTNAASDIASTIFGAPRSTEDILALVELGIIKEDYITGYLPAYVAGAHAARSGLFDLIFNLGANWGIQKAAAGVGGKVAGGWLGKLIGGAAGAIAGPLGAIFGGIVGGGVFNWIASLFGRRGGGPPKKWYKDWSPTGILFPVVLVVGPILLISATSLFLNPITLGGAFQQPQYGPVVDCRTNPDSPLCKFESCTGDNCAWPATGPIFQGPFATCDGTTHRRVDAIDIDGHYLDPVYSATDGTISFVSSSMNVCPDNPPRGGCNENYGNFVEVITPDKHILRYAHLSELFIDRVHVGESVKKGVTIIGKMDASGTDNEHLHFEVRGQPIGQSIIAKYLPVDENFARQLYKCINVGGCSSCPQMK